MTDRRGARVGDYRAPLFLAWQLTNACRCLCLACCEESGPDKAWPRELSRDEALKLAHDIVDAGIPHVAFGGGEPVAVPHFWEICEILHQGAVGIKLETDGLLLDAAACARLQDWRVPCVQVSLDGASAVVHEKMRPGGSFSGAVASVRRLADAGLEPEVVFAPTRFNLADAAGVYDLAASCGARTFVTGPLMRLGRAAADWERLAPDARDWQKAVAALEGRARLSRDKVRLAIYPWDIREEIRVRRESPQAMVLVVPDGKVKLLNALPFAPGDLRRQSLLEAWQSVCAAWRSDKVSGFIDRVLADPTLLRHANECWDV
jgi:MoaA/NifB/PqqE/SkfB family radical SAM enzyme